MSGRDTVEVKVFRFDPAVDAQPYVETHVVPHLDGATVLDALEYIYENFDSTLSFRWSCRSGQCGLCALRVDGKPRLACATRTVKNSQITLTPLETFKVEIDLTVDFTPAVQRMLRVNPYIQTADAPSEHRKIAAEDRPIPWKAARCIECWICQDVCPASRHDAEGFAGPAIMTKLAKLRFHEKDRAPRDASTVAEGLYSCTLCLECADACPKEINIPTIAIEPLRASAFEAGVSPPQGLRAVLDLLMAEGRAMPKQGVSFLEQAPEVVEVEDAADEVIFFPGCIIDRALPPIGFAALEVLRRNKIRVHIPKQQTCSGYPALAVGDRKLLREHALRNVATLEASRVSKVVTACPECAYMLGVRVGEIAERTLGRKPKFEAYELTDYLTSLQRRDKLNREMRRVKGNAAYHDACVLNRAFHVSEEPRKLLTSIPSLLLTEMRDAAVCSGAGGGMIWTNLPAAEALGRLKLQHARDTKADTLAVSCPFCVLHLRKYAEGGKPPLKVCHVAELLAEAYGGKR